MKGESGGSCPMERLHCGAVCSYACIPTGDSVKDWKNGAEQKELKEYISLYMHTVLVLVQSQPAASATQLQPTISQVLHQIPPAPSSTSLHLRPQPTMFGSQLQLPSAATALPQYQCKYSYISQLQPPSASLFPRCSLLLPAPDSTKLNCIHRHCPQPLAFRLSFPPQLLPYLSTILCSYCQSTGAPVSNCSFWHPAIYFCHPASACPCSSSHSLHLKSI
ncbi:uncharacterized protein LOC121882228 [Thunnus maccoyii]|uniref:uncharacterized protein LOC121882228 n=1 Tax=Thunnus maccoyii TaxID=8240 RepID=UPI001C4B308B|nr:uncharacterized protein LOC121882228 [Thunnus maccoyii]